MIYPARIWRERHAHYRLVGVKCRKCGAIHYPPRPVCDKCGSRELERIELPRRGKLISYTILHDPPTGYRDQAPLIVGIIELENGVRVLATLTDVDEKDLKIGMEVEAVLRRINRKEEYGVIPYALKFRPILT